jgi:hypothetical protein
LRDQHSWASGRWFYAFAARDFVFGVILAVAYYRLA